MSASETVAPSETAAGPDGRVDAYGVRFGQGLVGTLVVLAFALDLPIVVPALALVLGIGAVFGLRYAPFGALYRRVVRPLTGIRGPKEAASPKRFAQTLGATFLALATVGLFGAQGLVQLAVGWGFAFLVAALALVAAVTDFCLACRMYPLFRRFAVRTGAIEG